MQFVAFHLYVMAVGFVTAGVSASFAQLVSGEPLCFGIEPKSMVASFGGVLLRILAGPVILMGNAWKGAKNQARSPLWLGLSTLIAGVWSLFSGALLVDLIVKF